jgi:hypothetical protein
MAYNCTTISSFLRAVLGLTFLPVARFAWCLLSNCSLLKATHPESSLMGYQSVQLYESYRKVPRLSQKRNDGLTYSILVANSFKIVSLGTYKAIPLFFPCFKSTMDVIFLNAVKYRLRFPLDVRHCFKASSLQFHFQFG